MYDLAIIGGGPAGAAGAVYAARKQLKTVLITDEFGGQSKVSEEIYNWIGTKAISGQALADSLKDHVMEYEGEYLTIHERVRAQKVTKQDDGIFVIALSNNETITAQTILVASGSRRRALDVPGADLYENKGVVYCASCDGPLFSGMDVVVIGGGNAGFESAAQLLAYTKSVTLLQRSDRFKADATTVEKVLAHPHMRAIKNAVPVRIDGEQFIKGITYRDTTTGQEITLDAQGVFVEIGQIPNTDFIADLVTCTEYGNIVIDPRTQRASVPGIWAAGDVTDGLYHQNNIAAGDAVKALEDIYLYIKA
ncbi:MAG: FAD-dependent oxidoreductase [Candidatus Pacebacteria bacterium]|nr:FAD-dependent oxidoreductase [Candidatus Paceibacterota bacterium]MCD8528366.1 FAD-dependent oxidoreductase [Candidatus Paceibacterota bacterium]MCD8563665.1 FAD-dependent oxidoreductase [Candidatus Paceibacterota bacterium]